MLTPDRLRELAKRADLVVAWVQGTDEDADIEPEYLDTAAGLRLAASLLEKLEELLAPRAVLLWALQVKDAIAAAQEEARG